MNWVKTKRKFKKQIDARRRRLKRQRQRQKRDIVTLPEVYCGTLFNFVDVGSLGGLVRPWCGDYINNLIKIDPFEKPGSDGKEMTYQACLSDYDGYAKFYVFNKKDCSGMYLPAKSMRSKKKFAVRCVRDVECYTLDNILDRHDVLFDFLKIDTQGAELAILRGSQRHLGDFSGLQLEVFTHKTYNQVPSLNSIVELLRDFSFALVGRVTKSKRQGDYLFVSTKSEKQKAVNDILQIYSDRITANRVIQFYKEVLCN